MSTLRRRVRSGDVESRFEDGKYWLADRPIVKHTKIVNPVINPAAQAPLKIEESLEIPNLASTPAPAPESLFASANQLLQELKRAYVFVLQEKEEQIMELKEEAADLKTLVKILELENDRLKANLSESAPIDSWLDKNI